MATPVGPPQPYKTGLCDCCADCGICCWGYWCSCWLFGDTSEKLDRAAGDPNAGCVCSCLLYYVSHLFCLQGLPGCMERERLRTQYNLQGENCPACCAYTCCGPCATCQDAREVRSREAERLSQTNAVAAPPQAEQMTK